MCNLELVTLECAQHFRPGNMHLELKSYANSYLDAYLLLGQGRIHNQLPFPRSVRWKSLRTQ